MYYHESEMSVKELLRTSIDLDLADDYDERLCIAFCGPMGLTDEGKKVFKEALDYTVSLCYDFHYDYTVGCVHCENAKQANLAKKLFESLAGYCADSDYEKWFIELD